MTSMAASTPGILDTVVQFFRDDGWRFLQIEGKPILQMGFSGDNGSWICYAQAREDQQRFLFYSVMESKVPANKRQEVAEYLTRANYGLIIGNFEMDFSDGEVRYKTSIDVEGGQLTPQMVRTMVYTNVLMMDRYLPGIMSVIYAGVSPADAVAQIEGQR
jgi:hypothetical protein